MALYGGTIFLAAFLLFLVQPLIGKYLLPWFGGMPAVWSAAMLFFQLFLTGGYAYAYGLVSRFKPRRQAQLHLALLVASAGGLLWAGLAWDSPILPTADWKPTTVAQPTWHVLCLLAVSVGLPYLLLSTSSPLLQAWFRHYDAGYSPYRLYALSNLGSMLALLCYPFLVEPTLALPVQGWLWGGGYLVCVLGLGTISLRLLRELPQPQLSPAERAAVGETNVRLDVRVLWVALSACASMMLLAITNQVTQEIAAIPFLWVLPLALYLLSFVICFSNERWYVRWVYSGAFFVGSVLLLVLLWSGDTIPLLIQIPIYALVLFICCMVCHGELVQLKPVPEQLPSFYLLVSIGGAIGGILVNLVFPYLFSGYWELQLGLLLCGLLLALSALVNRNPTPKKGLRRQVQVYALNGALGVAVVLLLYIPKIGLGALESSRNFYGVLRVVELNAERPAWRANYLAHGATVHGFQFVDPERRHVPTAYFTERSGIGLLLQHYPREERGLRIGVLGLGIGTLAAYGRPGDVIRFYEINPEVARLAQGEGGFFHFLRDSPAQVEVVLGDARVSLEQELAAGRPQHYDVLVLDAFNSDSIPLHLLTREAFSVYLQHLEPRGVLAVQISNRALDLRPVVWGLADEFQLYAILIEAEADDAWQYPSMWMLLAPEEDLLQLPALADRSSPRPADLPVLRLWTDDYSNLLLVIR